MKYELNARYTFAIKDQSRRKTMDQDDEFFQEDEIIAWMPLPKYEEDDDEFIRKEDFV